MYVQVHTVDLRWNAISDVLLNTILDTLAHNRTIDALELNGNSMRPVAVERIKAALLRTVSE